MFSKKAREPQKLLRFRQNWRFYFEYVIDFSNHGSLLAGKPREIYSLYCTRAMLISKPIPN